MLNCVGKLMHYDDHDYRDDDHGDDHGVNDDDDDGDHDVGAQSAVMNTQVWSCKNVVTLENVALFCLTVVKVSECDGSESLKSFLRFQ